MIVYLIVSIVCFILGGILGWFLCKKFDKSLLEALSLQFKLSEERLKNLAQSVFSENSKTFSSQSEKQINSLMKPFENRLLDFKNLSEKRHETQIKDQASLKTEISHVIKAHEKSSKVTENLTNALKGDSQVQGAWGEFHLNRVLENSGLVKNEDYKTQESFKGEDSSLQRPDVVIYLPENKNMIIDSKVSLVSYESLVNAKNTEQKDHFSKAFFSSLKKHVDDLSDKKYEEIKEINSPDFVLLYIPLESAMTYIIKTKPAFIHDYAQKKKIIVVSPLSLIPILKTVSYLLSLEKQNKYSKDVAYEVSQLYDKFVSFKGNLENIDSHLFKAKESYDKAFKQLSQGQGNIVDKIEKIKKIGGLSTKKQIKN